MSAGWKLEESRLIQTRAVSSAANADSLYNAGNTVPLGKIWIITGVGYLPSVAETQVVSFVKVNAAGQSFGLLNPASMNLNPAVATFIEQGMEYVLFPGEYMAVLRVTHTAGSTMGLTFQFMEIDQPLYTYEEPQVVKRQQRAISSIRTALGGGTGRSSGATVAPSGGRPSGGRGGLPV